MQVASRLLCIAALRPLLLITFLFGNRSQRLAGPHTQDIRMTRMVRSYQAQTLNKSHGAYMPCVDRTIAATKKIWPLVLAQADEATSTRVVIIKLGAHMQKGGSQLSPLFLFIEWQIRSSTKKSWRVHALCGSHMLKVSTLDVGKLGRWTLALGRSNV